MQIRSGAQCAGIRFTECYYYNVHKVLVRRNAAWHKETGNKEIYTLVCAGEQRRVGGNLISLEFLGVVGLRCFETVEKVLCRGWQTRGTNRRGGDFKEIALGNEMTRRPIFGLRG